MSPSLVHVRQYLNSLERARRPPAAVLARGIYSRPPYARTSRARPNRTRSSVQLVTSGCTPLPTDNLLQRDLFVETQLRVADEYAYPSAHGRLSRVARHLHSRLLHHTQSSRPLVRACSGRIKTWRSSRCPPCRWASTASPLPLRPPASAWASSTASLELSPSRRTSLGKWCPPHAILRPTR